MSWILGHMIKYILEKVQDFLVSRKSQGKKEEALKLYQIVKSKYALSAEAATIDKYIERASAH